MEFLESFWAIYNTLIFTLGVNALLALSIYITLSCGLLSMANAAFMGIGAYIAALLTLKLDVPFGIALLSGGIVPALIALLIALPTLRLSGVYLAIATLSLGEVVRVVALNLEITGGPLGLNGIPTKTQGWHILLVLSLTLYLLMRIKHSKIGRAFEAIKEDEVAAQLMGINLIAYKTLAFVLGAFIAGIAGALNAHFTFFISPNEFGFDRGIEILTMAVLGGTVSVIGPLLGGTLITLLPELLRFLKDYRLIINGLILVLVVLFLPKGIWDPKRFRNWLPVYVK